MEPTVSFSLTVPDPSQALEFYAHAFGAQELFRLPAPDGSVAHAEFMIGNSRIFMSGEAPEWHAFAMPEGQLASCLFSIATEDCDRSHNRALDAGAESLGEPQNFFWGTRSSIVKDPFGYRWSFHQKIEDLTPDEIQRRAKELFSGSPDPDPA
jgi:PhnB protein